MSEEPHLGDAPRRPQILIHLDLLHANRHWLEERCRRALPGIWRAALPVRPVVSIMGARTTARVGNLGKNLPRLYMPSFGMQQMWVTFTSLWSRNHALEDSAFAL